MGYLDKKFLEVLRCEYDKINSKNEIRRAQIRERMPRVFRLTAYDVIEILKEFEKKETERLSQRKFKLLD